MGWSSGRNIAMLGLVGAGITLMLGLSWAPSVSISAFKAPEAQRIFYWHVPSAWAAMIAFTMLFVGSTFWFFKRSEWAWRLHVASSEAGLATGLVMTRSEKCYNHWLRARLSRCCRRQRRYGRCLGWGRVLC